MRSYAGVSLLRFLLIGLFALSLLLLFAWWRKLVQQQTAKSNVIAAISQAAGLAALAASVFVFPGVFWLSLC
ncbi:hypothetical protein [Agrobacterium sp. DE0009]|uniref:hypothetical protein n=1 Tax=Agrobacterium sp. DE0009 TaxID=2587505 RepID=UPI0011A00D20|nr:hypothetical protein [Agrobacterium sp. DE0009]